MPLSSEDEKFLDYVRFHSQTPRHAFSTEDARKLMRLAGVETPRKSPMTASAPPSPGGFPSDLGDAGWDRTLVLCNVLRKRLEERP